MSLTYIIGGPSRAGKSILSRRVVDLASCNYIMLDSLALALQGGFPGICIGFDQEIDSVRKRLHDFLVIWICKNARYGSYLYESVHVTPRLCSELRENIEIRPVFIGYADACVEAKANSIRRFAEEGACYTKKMSDTDLKSLVEEGIVASQQIKAECAKHGIPYVDMGRSFENGMAQAIRVLCS
jgi:hypothetical protein